MARYTIFVFSDCKDPARAAEFNDWYSNTHLPDMLQVPGMIQATRWEAAEPKENMRRQYLAVYDIETDDIAATNREIARQGKWTMDSGRFSDLPVFDPDNIPRIYRQITPVKKPKRQPKKPAGGG